MLGSHERQSHLHASAGTQAPGHLSLAPPRTRRRGYPNRGAQEGLSAVSHPSLQVDSRQHAALQPPSQLGSNPSSQPPAQAAARAHAACATSIPLESDSSLHSTQQLTLSSRSCSSDVSLYTDSPPVWTPCSKNVPQHAPPTKEDLQPHSRSQHAHPDDDVQQAASPLPTAGRRQGPGLTDSWPASPPGPSMQGGAALDVLLSRQIKACRTWRDFVCVFRTARPLLNHVHLTAVAGGMARARPGHAASTAEVLEFTRCLEEVLCAVPPYLPRCRPRELSTLAWAAAKAGAWMAATPARHASALAHPQTQPWGRATGGALQPPAGRGLSDHANSSSRRNGSGNHGAPALSSAGAAGKGAGGPLTEPPLDEAGMGDGAAAEHHPASASSMGGGDGGGGGGGGGGAAAAASCSVPSAAAGEVHAGPEWWALMLGAMQPLLPRFNPHDLSMTLWAVARACGAGDPDLQSAPPPFAALPGRASGSSSSSGGSGSSGSGDCGGRRGAAGGAQEGRVMALDGQGVPRAGALSSGPQRHALVPRLPDGFVEAVVAAVAVSLDRFGPQALSNSLWALASLRCRPGTRWLCAFVDASTAQMPHAAPQALANTAWALTLMEAPLTPAWRTAFMAAAASAASAAPPASLAQILWAAARLKLQPPAGWVAAMVAPLLACGQEHGRTAQPASGAAPGGPAAAAAAAAAAAGANSAVQWGPAALGQLPGPGLPQPLAVQRGPKRRAGACTSQDLANAAFAVAQLGKKGTKVHPQVMHSLLHTCSSRARDFSARELAAIVSACGAARFNPGRPVLAPLLAAFGVGMHRAGPQAAANVLWAVARLGVAPPAAWVEGCVAVLAAELEDVGPQEVANVWWALGMLRFHPPPALRVAMAVELEQHVEAMKAEEVVMVMVGHARLNIPLHKEALDRLLSYLVAQQLALWRSGSREDAAAATHNMVSALSALALMERNKRSSSRSSSGGGGGGDGGSGSSDGGSSSGGCKRGKGGAASGRSQHPAVMALLMQAVVHDRWPAGLPGGPHAPPPPAVAQQQPQQQQQPRQQGGRAQQEQGASTQHERGSQSQPQPLQRPMRTHRRHLAGSSGGALGHLSTAPAPLASLPSQATTQQPCQTTLVQASVHGPAAEQAALAEGQVEGQGGGQGSPWQLRGCAWARGDLAVVLYSLAWLRIAPPKEWACAALGTLQGTGGAPSPSSSRSRGSSGNDGSGMNSRGVGGRAPLHDLSMLAWSVACLCRPQTSRLRLQTISHAQAQAVPTRQLQRRQQPAHRSAAPAQQQHAGAGMQATSPAAPRRLVLQRQGLWQAWHVRVRLRRQQQHPSMRPAGEWGAVETRAWAETLLPQLAAAPAEAWSQLGITPLLGLAWATGRLWPAQQPAPSPAPLRHAPASVPQGRQAQLPMKRQQLGQLSQQQKSQQDQEQQQRVRALLATELQQRAPHMAPCHLSCALTALAQLLGPLPTRAARTAAPQPRPPAQLAATSQHGLRAATTADTPSPAPSRSSPISQPRTGQLPLSTHLMPPRTLTAAPARAAAAAAAAPAPTGALASSSSSSSSSSSPVPSLRHFLASLTAFPGGPAAQGAQLRSFDVRALCSLLWALGCLQAPVSPEWLVAACRQLQAQLNPAAAAATRPSASHGATAAAASPAGASRVFVGGGAKAAAVASTVVCASDCERAAKGLQRLQLALACSSLRRRASSNNSSSSSSSSSSNGSGNSLLSPTFLQSAPSFSHGSMQSTSSEAEQAPSNHATTPEHVHAQHGPVTPSPSSAGGPREGLQAVGPMTRHASMIPSTSSNETAAAAAAAAAAACDIVKSVPQLVPPKRITRASWEQQQLLPLVGHSGPGGAHGAEQGLAASQSSRAAPAMASVEAAAAVATTITTTMQQRQQLLVLQQATVEVHRTCVLLRQAQASALHRSQEGRLARRMRMFMLPSCQPRQKRSAAGPPAHHERA